MTIRAWWRNRVAAIRGAREPEDDNDPAALTATDRRRAALKETVQRNARGNVQLAAGEFVTREDLSLSDLDR